MIDTAQGRRHQPTDLSLGPHQQCEQCDLWYPAETLALRLGKLRCEPCRDPHAARHSREDFHRAESSETDELSFG